MLRYRRIDCGEQIRRLLLRAWRFLPVDFELHTAVCQLSFEQVAVKLGVVESKDAGS
jgi:hypothetical protein